jgi:hypothetical protein
MVMMIPHLSFPNGKTVDFCFSFACVCFMECINNISNMDDMEILTSLKEEILDLLEGNADGLDVLY